MRLIIAAAVALAVFAHPGTASAAAIAKMYVETSSQILGYRIDGDNHAERVCEIPLVLGEGGTDIAVDKNGNLLEPMSEAYPAGVEIFAGPVMCGQQVGLVVPRTGYPVDATSLNALTGNIVVAAVPPFSISGGVFVCRISESCSELYTGQPPYEGYAIAVAIDSVGDCWAVLPFYASSTSWALEYFRGCRESGVVVTGWVNPSGGGLDVDERGNLLLISSAGTGSALYVYRGCKPSCTRIGGPFPLGHGAVYGHVSRDNTMFASTGDGFVDVYS